MASSAVSQEGYNYLQIYKYGEIKVHHRNNWIPIRDRPSIFGRNMSRYIFKQKLNKVFYSTHDFLFPPLQLIFKLQHD